MPFHYVMLILCHFTIDLLENRFQVSCIRDSQLFNFGINYLTGKHHFLLTDKADHPWNARGSIQSFALPILGIFLLTKTCLANKDIPGICLLTKYTPGISLFTKNIPGIGL